MKAKILDVKKREGSYFTDKRWGFPMQEVITEVRSFLENDTGRTAPSAHWKPQDFSALKGSEVEFTVHTDNGQLIPDDEVKDYPGYTWIKLKKVL